VLLQDILKDAIESDFNHATQLPYFEGDFWPNVIEDCIKELEQEEMDKRQHVDMDTVLDVDEVEVETTEISEVGDSIN
jgi:E1A/CREB-binding protein